MARKNYLMAFALLGFAAFSLNSCEDEPTETCAAEEICDAQEVTSCCEGDVCVYKYNGKEYAESEIDQLAEDMNCGGNAVGLKSADYEADIDQVVQRLNDLLQRVKAEHKR